MGITQSRGGGVASPATASRLDPQSLIPSRLHALAWSTGNPTMAPLCQPLAGDSAITGAGGLSALNAPDGLGVPHAPAGAYLSCRFTVPTTGVYQLELDEVGQHPLVGATGPLTWSINYGAASAVTLPSASFSVGAALANITSGSVTLTAGVEYEVRLPVNPVGGSSMSCLVGRIRVRPLAATGLFASFVALDVLGLLHGNRTLWGYDATQPRYVRRNGFAEVRFKTNAATMGVETFSNSETFLAAPHANFAVRVEGVAAGQDATAVYDPVQEQIAVTQVTLPAALARVTVRDGEATTTAYPFISPQPRGTFVRRLFFPASAVVDVELPLPVIIAFGPVDSKAGGAGATDPARAATLTFLKVLGFDAQQRYGWSGATFAQFCGDGKGREGVAYAMADADYVVVEAIRNDYIGNSTTAQSVATDPTTGTMSLFVDNLHALGRCRVILPGIFTENATNEALVWGSGGGTANGLRNGLSAIAAGTGTRDNLARSSWCFASDPLSSLSTIAQAAANGATGADGAHPNTYGQWLQALAIQAVVTGGQLPSAPLASLSPLFWHAVDADQSTSGALGAVTSAGTTPPTITLSGTPARAMRLDIRCSTVGALGTWWLQYSIDGDSFWSAPILSAASVPLGDTGVTAAVSTGGASLDNTWYALSAAGTVLDLSGNGHTLATTGTAPMFTRNAINGRSALQVTASVNTQSGMHVGSLSLTQVTIALMATTLDIGTAGRYLFGGASASSSLILYELSGSIYVTNGTSQTTALVCDTTKIHSIIVTYNDGTGAVAIWVDGIKAKTGTLTGNVTTSDIAFGWGNGGSNTGGYLAEDLGWGRILGDDEIRVVAGSMRQKYGTP